MQRGRVRLVPHSPDWAQAFRIEREELLSIGSGLLVEVEHVGSTAVPGLQAKPIVDMVGGLTSTEALPLLAGMLPTVGWIDRGDKGEDGGYLFVKESAPDFRTHHLHLVEHGGRQWTGYLAFRDRLISDKKLRKEYSALKRDLESAFIDDRASYTARKAEFVRNVLESLRETA